MLGIGAIIICNWNHNSSGHWRRCNLCRCRCHRPGVAMSRAFSIFSAGHFYPRKDANHNHKTNYSLMILIFVEICCISGFSTSLKSCAPIKRYAILISRSSPGSRLSCSVPRNRHFRWALWLSLESRAEHAESSKWSDLNFEELRAIQVMKTCFGAPHSHMNKQETFAKERNWEQHHTPRNIALAMVGEVGEICECFQVSHMYQVRQQR